MRVPRRLVMTPGEKGLLYGEDQGPLFPRAKSELQELHRIYSRFSADDLPEPAGLQSNSKKFDAGLCGLGGMRVGFDFSEYKRLPYKTQAGPSLNVATSS